MLLSKNRKLEYQVRALKKMILDINSKERELYELKNRARFNVLQAGTDSEEVEEARDFAAEPKHASKKPLRKVFDASEPSKSDEIDKLFKSFRQENNRKKAQNW